MICSYLHDLAPMELSDDWLREVLHRHALTFV